MMPLALILIPTIAGLAAFAIRPARARRLLLVLTALTHTALCAGLCTVPAVPGIPGWIGFDALGLFFVCITSALFLATAFYTVSYLRREKPGAQPDLQEHFLFVNAPEAVFIGCLLLFLATMTLVCASRRFGLLWVAIEATTLASAPLIYFHRHHRSLEATWKYLLICSVGIALALLGNFFLALSTVATGAGGGPLPLVMDLLVARGPTLQVAWLKAAFIFLLVGYGTKTGLAPLHTWLPDAHSEAPSLVSALLSGALLNCALLGILRGLQVCVAAGQGAFARDLLLVFGLVSIAVAAVFILGQTDFKRMLAYSSVEHMGIVALGLGLGGYGTFGAVFHTLNHSLTKGMLFLLAGNILAVFRTKVAADVRGLRRALPWTGGLWLLGFLAITGFPPFGTFLSELAVLRGAFDAGRYLVAAAYLVLLAIIFMGMCSIVLRMVQGTPAPAPAQPGPDALREPSLSLWPPACLGLAVLILGVYIPEPLSRLLNAVAQELGG